MKSSQGYAFTLKEDFWMDDARRSWIAMQGQRVTFDRDHEPAGLIVLSPAASRLMGITSVPFDFRPQCDGGLPREARRNQNARQPGVHDPQDWAEVQVLRRADSKNKANIPRDDVAGSVRSDVLRTRKRFRRMVSRRSLRDNVSR